MYTEIKYMYLKQHTLTNGLSEGQIMEFCDRGKLRQVKKGESIYLAEGYDDRIYLLLKGKVKVSEVDDSGGELIKEILTEPDVFGDVSLNGNISEDEFAEALTENTVVLSFKSADFKQVMQGNPVLAMNFATQVTGKFRRLESRHSNLVFKDAKGRLLSFFKDWAKREGSMKGDKIVLNNYLTHNDIAGIISTSRQSVTTLLNELRDTGFLFYNRKRIEINAPQFSN
ncbi:MAG: Crp/Fnr family transcriptional regulator [Sphingobacteriales bacterium]|nr:Crp/Fnr family transcriptional regulator [Sphingobacteriales bacterium]MBI3718655.1 Crp/Fnr family transcriptional regulator [Sphingobacteriales bacterium]